jgi:hypothetical protein
MKNKDIQSLKLHTDVYFQASNLNLFACKKETGISAQNSQNTENRNTIESMEAIVGIVKVLREVCAIIPC